MENFGLDGNLLKASKGKGKEESRNAIEQKIKEVDDKMVRSDEVSLMKPTDLLDWTQNYKYWSKWEDKEDLERQKQSEIEKLDRINENSGFLGHTHDREEERRIFSLDEDNKIKLCEKHRLLGNYLFREGLYPKAAEQYKISLSYYEYCFPTESAIQDELDDLRSSCLVNLSVCLFHLGEHRASIQSASQAIGREIEGEIRGGEGGGKEVPWSRDLSRFEFWREEPEKEESGRNREGMGLLVKALFRRALSLRELHLYDESLSDLNRALLILSPPSLSLSSHPSQTETRLRDEIRHIQLLKRVSDRVEKEVAQNMLQTTT